MLGAFINCAKTVLPALPNAQCCNGVYKNASISSFSYCHRQNMDQFALAYCGGVEFTKFR
jgi:hypothetical protein